MKSYIALFITLLAIWYFLSSEYTILFLIYAFISVLSTIFICMKMNLINIHSTMRYNFIIRVLKYYIWIIKSVLLASLDVSKRIWSAQGSSNSGFCKIKIPSTNEKGIVAFANSITLTPGTISVYLNKDSVVVHTMDTSLSKTLEAETAVIIKKVNELVGFKNK